MSPTKPITPAFTKSLPKVELHAHLTGSISRQCLHEIWARKKAENPAFDVQDPWEVMPPGKVDYSLATFFNVFSNSIYNLCSDLPSIAYATTSVLKDFHADGIHYLELRTIPRPSPSFSREEYLLTVLDAIDAFSHTQATLDPDTHKMTTRVILAIDRGQMSPADANEVIDLAIANGHRGVVGIDICGNPTNGDVSIFAVAMERAKSAGLALTVHFGEVSSSTLASSSAKTAAEAEKALESELREMLSWNPRRLGHVIHVPSDIKDEIKKRGLGLELCLSCNVHASMFDGGFADHHFGEWWGGSDCVVVLCTDDVGFFCSPVSNEYLLAAEHFKLSRADILRLCRRSYDVIFEDETEKERLRQLLDEFESNYAE
ncbi:Metallo-dependent hydrolase [Aspergillus campestris IBT 28561]|uniref:Metallo-dependent hydrolase n=1 Tax=Aspergillus campestris (strain IBT 28561) TaxID=1392248 RepID=A0A2I1DG88_ASPC2|nr:Metallo-dependent hydrolase [Aspergillus campestris IBT 28561]PKY08887.1 Metallo-dependent hydrolase [Aspergillus campestris IBT 28561]